MKEKVTHRAKSLILAAAAVIVMVSLAPSLTSNRPVQAAEDGIIPFKWTTALPSRPCGVNNPSVACTGSSPVLADIDGDGRDDIVVGTNNGHVVAIRHNGTILWNRDVAPYFGMAANSEQIESSPAVADIDNDGYPEIAVGVGSKSASACTQGGTIVLNHNGVAEAGWPKLSMDLNSPTPIGCRETVYSTPALGDLDNDGLLEVVYGGFDKRIYARHHDGTMVSGFTPDSFHRDRFPTWPQFVGALGDTIWGSPVLADINGDGYQEILIGSDEGNFDARWGGDADGWTCPYAPPPGYSAGYCGGSLYAIDRFGNVVPGFPIYVHETVQSTPAVADVNGDGMVEIFFGTGSYYYANSPDRPTNGFRVYAYRGDGQPLAGWAGGKVVGGSTPASPSIGDLNGDGVPEIVMASMDMRLHAWRINGQPVGGFPMIPLTQNGANPLGFNVGTAFILGDYDGNGEMEIFVNRAGTVAIVDGNGQQLTMTNFPNDSRPLYYAENSLANTPAVGDIDNDGQLELVVVNDKAYAWDLTSASDEADWGMYKQNAARTSAWPQPPRMQAAPFTVTAFHQYGTSGQPKTSLIIRNLGDGSFNWAATPPSGVTLVPSSGTVGAGGMVAVIVRVNPGGRSPGQYSLGNISVTASENGDGAVLDPSATIPITLIVGNIAYSYIPIVLK